MEGSSRSNRLFERHEEVYAIIFKPLTVQSDDMHGHVPLKRTVSLVAEERGGKRSGSGGGGGGSGGGGNHRAFQIIAESRDCITLLCTITNFNL